MFKILLFALLLGNVLEKNFLIENTSNRKIEEINQWDSISFLILYSQYNCTDCFDKLIPLIQKEYPQAQIRIIARCGQINFEGKKRCYDAIPKILKKFPIYFDIHNSFDPWPPKNLKDGIFGYYKVSITPVLLYYEPSRPLIYFNYDDVMKIIDEEENISIRDFLKMKQLSIRK